MIKEIREIKEVVEQERFCDVCGKKLHFFGGHKCDCCNKDLCIECVEVEEFSGDCDACWCKTCWDIGKEYSPKIKELNDTIERLHEEWVNKCKEVK